jgi:hypothetical protein
MIIGSLGLQHGHRVSSAFAQHHKKRNRLEAIEVNCPYLFVAISRHCSHRPMGGFDLREQFVRVDGHRAVVTALCRIAADCRNRFKSACGAAGTII